MELAINIGPKDHQFVNKEGKKVSVYQYFKEAYKIDLDPNFPLLRMKARGKDNRDIYLPAQLCKFRFGRKRRADLNKKERDKMINITRHVIEHISLYE
jgi:hypothetical protein